MLEFFAAIEFHKLGNFVDFQSKRIFSAKLILGKLGSKGKQIIIKKKNFHNPWHFFYYRTEHQEVD